MRIKDTWGDRGFIMSIVGEIYEGVVIIPNWCTNELVIDIPKHLLDDVVEAITTQRKHSTCQMTFSALIPEPGGDDWDTLWYEWRIANWGTKWDLGEADAFIRYDRADGGYRLMAEFNTAWAPPIPWVATLAEKFPEAEIEISFDEPGMDFSGTFSYSAGVLADHIEGPSYMYEDEDEDEENA